MSKPMLQTAVANYGHTNPLKDGSITSEMFDMEHHEITPVPMIFRRMVRNLEFDVAENGTRNLLMPHERTVSASQVFRYF